MSGFTGGYGQQSPQQWQSSATDGPQVKAMSSSPMQSAFAPKPTPSPYSSQSLDAQNLGGFGGPSGYADYMNRRKSWIDELRGYVAQPQAIGGSGGSPTTWGGQPGVGVPPQTSVPPGGPYPGATGGSGSTQPAGATSSTLLGSGAPPYGSVNYPGSAPAYSVSSPTTPNPFADRMPVPREPGREYSFYDRGNRDSPTYDPSYQAPPFTGSQETGYRQRLDLANRYQPLNTSLTPASGESFMQFAQRIGFPIGAYGQAASMGAPSSPDQWMSHLQRWY